MTLAGCSGGDNSSSSTPTQTSELRYLQVSGTAPNSQYVVDNKAKLEEAPFNGTVLALMSGRIIFHPTALFSSPSPAYWFAADQANLPNINSSILTDNFLLMRGNADASFDPFSDTHWATASANIRTVAQMAKLGQLKGVAFDPEGYTPGRNIFTYATYSGHTFAQCKTQLRLRGQQFMSIIQEEHPNSVVFLFGGLSMQRELLNAAQAQADPDAYIADRLENSAGMDGRYGLLPSFLNGMLDVISTGMQIVDGSEVTYTYSRSEDYTLERELTLTYARNHLVDSSNRTKYANQVKLGASVYMDASFDQLSDSSNLAHYMNSATRTRFFNYQLYWGLKTTDKYMWIYSETADWYKGTDIPSGATTAMTSAKARVDASQDQGDSTIEADIATAEAQVP